MIGFFVAVGLVLVVACGSLCGGMDGAFGREVEGRGTKAMGELMGMGLWFVVLFEFVVCVEMVAKDERINE